MLTCFITFVGLVIIMFGIMALLRLLGGPCPSDNIDKAGWGEKPKTPPPEGRGAAE